MKGTVAFTSLGCDKNRVDSEVMLGILAQNGFQTIADEAEADIIVINTCCFIKDALDESIETILEMAEYKKTGKCKGLIVAGCLGQRYEKEFFDELPEVDAVIGTAAYESVAEVAADILKGKMGEKYLEDIDRPMEDTNGKLRILSTAPYFAYLKISEGCDNHCTYCVIPKLRGKHRSRTMESLVEEARYWRIMVWRNWSLLHRIPPFMAEIYMVSPNFMTCWRNYQRLMVLNGFVCYTVIQKR